MSDIRMRLRAEAAPPTGPNGDTWYLDALFVTIRRQRFRVGRDLLRAAHYRSLRTRSLRAWQEVTCVC